LDVFKGLEQYQNKKFPKKITNESIDLALLYKRCNLSTACKYIYRSLLDVDDTLVNPRLYYHNSIISTSYIVIILLLLKVSLIFEFLAKLSD